MTENTIEQDVLEHMASKMNVPVLMERQLNPDPEYVLLEKTGSSKREHLKTSTFAMQSIAQSLYDACNLNELTKAAAESLIELDRVTRVDVLTDYNYTDTARKEYRYQAVVQITHY